MKAVCLLSGGLDSGTTAAIAKSQGYDLYCISVNYGQRLSKELERAKRVVKALEVKEHKVLDLSFLKELTKGATALTDETIEVPKDRNLSEMSAKIPITYVPGRNTILLSIAMSYAESIDAEAIFIGAHYLDYSGYPDCRPEYFQALQKVIELGTRVGTELGKPIKLETPILMYSKKEVIKKGLDLEKQLCVEFLKYTWSCYEGLDKPCGTCDSCKIRQASFDALGIIDPAFL